MDNENSNDEALYRETIKKALRGLRGLAGLSANELSERAAIPLATLQSIESGRRPFSPMQSALIQFATGVDAAGLMRGELWEWDRETPYAVSSFGRWLAEGIFRQKKEWLSDLKKLNRETEENAKELDRKSLLIFVSYSLAMSESELNPDKISSALSNLDFEGAPYC